MLFTKPGPKAPKILWKLHRFWLKKAPFWFWLILPGGTRLRVRYRAEGSINYLFLVRDESRLLRITRRQFYALSRPEDEKATVANCALMNSLAEANISVKAEHLVGGACLVENAGTPVTETGLLNRRPIDDIFAALVSWSLKSGLVLLDYNEENWCLSPETGRLLLVDVDSQFTCPLTEIGKNQVVSKRVAPGAKGDLETLEAFLQAEADLLWDYLVRAQPAAAPIEPQPNGGR